MSIMSIKDIKIFKKGSEDVFYNYMEGDIYVNYYLICKFDGNRITKACSFSYSPYVDVYFSMNDFNRLKNILTLEEANDYDVGTQRPDINYQGSLSDIIDKEFIDIWIDFHKLEYDYMYETDTEDIEEDYKPFIWNTQV